MSFLVGATCIGPWVPTHTPIYVFAVAVSETDLPRKMTHDLSACVRNIQRAKTQWAAVSKVPEARGCRRIVCEVIPCDRESTVLLYGSDTWWLLDVWKNCSPLSQPMPQAHHAQNHPMYRCRE
jgi:hypothetical protein